MTTAMTTDPAVPETRDDGPPSRPERDILDCLAQLSNSNVPTPPVLAEQMLNLLPAEVWARPDYVWVDPFSKSGIFLREAASRLLDGLEDWEPDFEKRREHIFRNMLYGCATIEITGEVSRRSLYYSRDAAGPESVLRFDDSAGNVPFVPAKHDYGPGGRRKRCRTCGASKKKVERGDSRENYAYAFIHGAYPTEEMKDMKFDVIVGNPPYHLEDGGHNNSATPVFHKFVEKAIEMNPRYLVMITPSRWFNGGKGLNGFRGRMLQDRHIRRLVDYPKLYDAFPGVKIRGGVSYFLWDRDHDGDCTVQTMWDGEPMYEPMTRDLGEWDVLVRWNRAVSALRKVRDYRVKGKPEPTWAARVSPMKPFGFRTYFHGRATRRGIKDPVKLYGSKKITWIDRSEILVNNAWVDDWKLLMSRVQGTSAAIERQFLPRPIIAGPGEACTETYVVAGRFATRQEAEYAASYLRTRFARFLVSARKATHDSARDVYAFIPQVSLDRVWTDADLYERYGLSEAEIEFIESHICELAAE
ncbi:Eco57I restriction-modification methylase domain-containing protein [Nocardioides sp. MH1]|uniref:Eco57I restriction-modification methylase domain-containing protein n=1 Tax=Nocardioides sp. MH1 TaxID=3242490 RepID=UPI0035200904